jgi:glycosyltransferase involved in cell wall biosynthesis
MNDLISIVTVTKNRPIFLEHLKHNILSLEYPQECIEWIVADNSDSPVLDCVKDFPNLVYCYNKSNTPLGAKRNFSNRLVNGKFVFYFDDDNYAFKTRITHSLDYLANHPECDIVGSSEMFILDISIGKVYVAGPFAENHASLGTWAFRRSLLERTRFSDVDSFGEELGFTQHWKLSIGQLDKEHTSVCVDHGKNTISKKHLLSDATHFFEIDTIVDDPISRTHFQRLIEISAK